MRMFNLSDLLTAFSLAKIQEQHVRINKKGFKDSTYNVLDLRGTKTESWPDLGV